MRLYAPEDGGTKYQVMFRAPAEGTDPLMTRLPLFGTNVRVAGFGGLRLGEQHALGAIGVFFDHGHVHVNPSWITPRRTGRVPRPVKNHTLHEVPLPKSLLHDGLLAGPVSFRGRLVQYAGRVLRTNPGKQTAEVHDNYDIDVPVHAAALSKRRAPATSASDSPIHANPCDSSRIPTSPSVGRGRPRPSTAARVRPPIALCAVSNVVQSVNA